MNKAIIGMKLGMTQVFTADGTMVPVTVVQAGPCPVVQVKSTEKEGYSAIQLGFQQVKESSLTKAEQGHLKKGNASSLKVLKEFDLVDVAKYQVGAVVNCDIFAEGETVDVTGVTKGHGFSGNIKRWNHHRLKETHGVGPVHREVGAMSANSNPARVFKGKKLPGQYGHEQVTILNLSVVKVDKARNLLLIKGAIPGAKNSIVFVRNAV
ncbi:MAG: 50S ribosomal protein L3, partial [Clostridia bacterium]